MITFTGELLSQAEKCIRMGVHPGDVVKGFELAFDEVKKIIESQVAFEV